MYLETCLHYPDCPVMSGLAEEHLGCSEELVVLQVFACLYCLHCAQLAANANSIVITLDWWASSLIQKQLTLPSVCLSNEVNTQKLCRIFTCTLHESVAGNRRLGALIHLLCIMSLLSMPSLRLHCAPQKRGPAGESPVTHSFGCVLHLNNFVVRTKTCRCCTKGCHWMLVGLVFFLKFLI